MPDRPFRATVYLPGHDEQGQGVVVTKLSAASQENLQALLEPYYEQGYVSVGYEVLALPLEQLDPSGLDPETGEPYPAATTG